MATHRDESAKNPTNEQEPKREQHGSKREKSQSGTGEGIQQLIFTMNATTGAVIKIEKIDPSGKRREVPKEETVALAGKDNLHEIEAALDEAFEAGISSVLEPSSHEEPSDETEEETELRRVLLSQLIDRSIRRRLQRRLVDRLVLSRTLADADAPRGPARP
jgi:hypothetical protein